MSSKWTSEEPEPDAGAAKPGRRRRDPAKDEDNNEKDSDVPARKQGGWGLDSGASTTTAEAKPARRRPQPDEDDGIGKRNRHFNNDDDNAEQIIDIPDLDDAGADGEDDITTQVAMAPKNNAKRVQSLRELDHDIQFTLPSTSAGLDLSLLTAALCPQSSVQEEDVAWEFDQLLHDVGQELQAELDEEENAKLEEAAGTVGENNGAATTGASGGVGSVGGGLERDRGALERDRSGTTPGGGAKPTPP